MSRKVDPPTRICWDEHGGLYLPPEYAYIGVAMDRRDAAEEIQRAFDGARRARMTTDDEPPREQAIEAAEDRAEQVAYEVWREQRHG